MGNGQAAALRTRPNVKHLADWDPGLLWYARAVAAMQLLGIGEPASWRYQAAIHDYDRDSDPFKQPTDVLPLDADDFWAKCQHSSWFFLPWHRAYLFFFEQIVADTIVKLGGPPNWSLPFWDYSDGTQHDARVLPKAFRDAKDPDGNNNALFVEARANEINAGQPLSLAGVRLACLKDADYVGTTKGHHPGFGGVDVSGDHPSGHPGSLETTPHGDVHNEVGGDGGFMGAFNTAGLDPIFWLHHANIDRLWEVWRNEAAHATGFHNPKDPAWLSGQGVSFRFHDATGAVVTLLPSQVTDTSAAPLLYEYEGVPVPIQTPAVVVAMNAFREAKVSMAEPVSELVGASATATPLSSTPVDVSVKLQAARGPTATAQGLAPAAKRVFLNFENVTGTPPIPGFEVTIGEGGTNVSVGTMPMFGVAEASRTTSQHAGSGITYVLEITAAVAELKSRGVWDPTKLNVTMTPKRALSGTVQVGRISIYEQ